MPPDRPVDDDGPKPIERMSLRYPFRRLVIRDNRPFARPSLGSFPDEDSRETLNDPLRYYPRLWRRFRGRPSRHATSHVTSHVHPQRTICIDSETNRMPKSARFESKDVKLRKEREQSTIADKKAANRTEPSRPGPTRPTAERRLRHSFQQFRERLAKEDVGKEQNVAQEQMQVPARIVRGEPANPDVPRGSTLGSLGSNKESIVQHLPQDGQRRRSSLATYHRKSAQVCGVLCAAAEKWMSTGLAQWEPVPSDLSENFSIPVRATHPLTRMEADSAKREVQENELLIPAVEKRLKDPPTDDLQSIAVYYRLGILHDNLGKYTQAIRMYERMREAATKMEREDIANISNNCIGVALQRKAGEGMIPAMLGQFKPRPSIKQLADATMIGEALLHHEEHMGKSSALTGKFVASTNMAICSLQVGDAAEGLIHAEKSVKVAKLMDDQKAVQVAVGNYACALGTARDKELEEVLSEFVSLSKELKDLDAQAWGHFMLGQCAERNANLPTAKERFEAANAVAVEAGNFFLESKALLLLGIVRGKMEFMKWKATARGEPTLVDDIAEEIACSGN